VGCDRDTWQNGLTNRDDVWDVDLGWCKERCMYCNRDPGSQCEAEFWEMML